MRRRGAQNLSLRIEGDGVEGHTTVPSYALVKDLRSKAASQMGVADESLELLYEGKALRLERTLAQAGVVDESVIVVQKKAKPVRVLWKNDHGGRTNKGGYGQLPMDSGSESDSTSEGCPEAGDGIVIKKVKRFRAGENLDLRDKLSRKYNKEVPLIDFILEALKMQQREIRCSMFCLGFCLLLSVMILTGGFVFLYITYTWKHDSTFFDPNLHVETLRELLEATDTFRFPSLDLYPGWETKEGQDNIFTGAGYSFPEWARQRWSGEPKPWLLGTMNSAEVNDLHRAFKHGRQPGMAVLLPGEPLNLKVHMCRSWDEVQGGDVELWCRVGVYRTSCPQTQLVEIFCRGGVCILAGKPEIVEDTSVNTFLNRTFEGTLCDEN